MLFPADSVNHSAPSGPETIAYGCEDAVGIGYSGVVASAASGKANISIITIARIQMGKPMTRDAFMEIPPISAIPLLYDLQTYYI
jgi:hypothetical protein